METMYMNLKSSEKKTLKWNVMSTNYGNNYCSLLKDDKREKNIIYLRNNKTSIIYQSWKVENKYL